MDIFIICLTVLVGVGTIALSLGLHFRAQNESDEARQLRLKLWSALTGQVPLVICATVLCNHSSVWSGALMMALIACGAVLNVVSFFQARKRLA